MSRVNEVLWHRYRELGDLQARSQLLDSFLGLVHHTAHDMLRFRPGAPELEDLIGAGTVGMVQALEGFDPKRGLAFSTYAMPRIRGAMLDELRGRDWMPRSIRTRSRLLNSARNELQQRLGRQPSNEELCAELKIELELLYRWQKETAGRILLQLDSGGNGGEDHEPRLSESIADLFAAEPGEALDDEETLAQLRGAFQRLTARDRMVLSLYYYEELNLRQIGEVMHVSESRISQIRTRALKRLRELVEVPGGVA